MKKISKKAEEMTVKELASYIDYSVLKPEFTEEQIIELTKDGVKLGCATICINPGYIELCTPYVEGTETGLCPGHGFSFRNQLYRIQNRTGRDRSRIRYRDGDRCCGKLWPDPLRRI